MSKKAKTTMENTLVETEIVKPVSIEKEIIEMKETKPVKPVIALRVFLQIFGQKWDQLAGFRSYAIRNQLEPLTVEKWRQAFTDFMNRPTQ